MTPFLAFIVCCFVFLVIDFWAFCLIPWSARRLIFLLPGGGIAGLMIYGRDRSGATK